jgi:hypothetical protein
MKARPEASRAGKANHRSATQARSMVERPAGDELVFDVLTPLGFTVRVSQAHWNVIITIKHPAMTGCEVQVEEALATPDEVRLSRTDKSVFILQAAAGASLGMCGCEAAER